VSWLEYLSSGWTLVVVPTAIAIAAIVGFVKTLLEKRNLQLENQKLQIEVAAATSRIVLATDEQVEQYAFRRHFVRRTIRLASIILAVALPTGLVFNTQLSRGPDILVPLPAPPALPVEIPRKAPPNLSLPIGRWAVRGSQGIAGRRISAIEFGADGRFTATSADGRIRSRDPASDGGHRLWHSDQRKDLAAVECSVTSHVTSNQTPHPIR
jgi:hypothetical protein